MVQTRNTNGIDNWMVELFINLLYGRDVELWLLIVKHQLQVLVWLISHIIPSLFGLRCQYYFRSNFQFRKIPSRSLAEHYVAVSVHEVLFDLLGHPVCCMFMNKNDKFVNSFIGKISAYYLMYKFNLLDCFSLDIFEKINGFKPF